MTDFTTSPTAGGWNWANAEAIDVCTRADLIRCGELVDVSATAAQAGFAWPVALTHAVWQDCVAWSDADCNRKGVPQDAAGRLWDVLWMASLATHKGGSTGRFHLVRIPRAGRGVQPRRVDLVVRCGPGDAGEPVVTITQPDED